MQGTMGLWAEPFTTLRLQKIFNLMQDPFERADVQYFLGLAARPRPNHVRRDGRCLPIRGHIQGLPTTLVPAELQPREHHGKHDGYHETEEGADGGVGPGSDSRRIEPDDRQTAPGSRPKVTDETPKAFRPDALLRRQGIVHFMLFDVC
jgi:hypothetical protein